MAVYVTRTQVEKLGKLFECSIETELHMSFVGLINFQVQNTFIIHQGKRYFIGLSNVAGRYFRLWNWETGLAAIHCDWNKVFQQVSNVSSANLWSQRNIQS